MKVKSRLRRPMAAVMSVILALAMTVGVMPVTPAAAAVLDEDETYTINYDLNTAGGTAAVFNIPEADGVDGTTQENVITITGGDGNYTGETYTIPSPTRTGYEFGGWKDADTEEPIVDDTDPNNPVANRVVLEADGEINVKASWSEASYNIIYEDESGEVYGDPEDPDNLPPEPSSYTYAEEDDQAITLPAVQTTVEPDEGYVWVWNDSEDDYAGGAEYTIAAGKTGDLTFTETQVPATYSISYYGAEATLPYENVNPSSYTYTTVDSAKITLPAIQAEEDPDEAGYEWQWSGDSDIYEAGDDYPITGLTGDLEFTEVAVPITYTISYQDKDGSGIVPPGATTEYTVEIADGKFALPAEQVSETPEGYTFAGWNDGTDTYEAGDDYDIDTDDPGNLVFKETWKPIGYAVAFVSQGQVITGEGYDNVTFNVEDTTFDLPAAPTAPDGYHFDSWQIDENSFDPGDEFDAAEYFDGEPFDNVTFTAVWEANTYTIRLDVDTDVVDDAALTGFGDATEGVYTVNATYGETYEGNVLSLEDVVPTTEQTAKYAFGGWYDESDSLVTEIDLTDFDNEAVIVITADWLMKYTVTYNLDGGSIYVDEETTYQDGYVDAITDDDLVDGKYLTYVPQKAGHVLTKWGVTGEHLTTDYTDGIAVADPTLSAEVNFAGIEPGDNITLTATWASSVTVNYDYGDGTAPTGANANPTFYTTGEPDSPEVLTLNNPTPVVGYKFTGWEAVVAEGDNIAFDLENEDDTSVDIDIVDFADAIVNDEGVKSVTFLAKYTPIEYTIAYTEPDEAHGGNAATIASGTADKDKYTVVSVVAFPTVEEVTANDNFTIDEGYEFIGWYDTTDDDKTIIDDTTDLHANLTLVAKYAPIEYDVTLTGLTGITDESVTALTAAEFAAVAGSEGTMKGTFTVEDLDETEHTLAIPNVAKAGYEFDGWKIGEADADKDVELTKAQLMSSPTLAATFSEKPYTITLTNIDTEAKVEAVTEVGFASADPDDDTCTTYVKTVTISTDSFDLPVLADDTDAHERFDGWQKGTDEPVKEVTIAETTADATYDAVFTEVPKVTINFNLSGGAFSDDDAEALNAFGYVATTNEKIIIYTDATAGIDAITPLPAPEKDESIFSGWAWAGYQDGDPLVMQFDVAEPLGIAEEFDDDIEINLTAHYEDAVPGETVVVAEGSARNEIDADLLAEIKDLVEDELQLPEGAVAITKVVADTENPIFHQDDDLEEKVTDVLVGGTVKLAYVGVTITTYITYPDGDVYNEEYKHTELSSVLDIAYDNSIVPDGVEAGDLKMVVRQHEGGLQLAAVADPEEDPVYSYTTFTKLSEKPAAGAEVDGTFWVDPVTNKTHVYSSLYSTFAFGYATGGYNVTFDANGGTFSDGSATKSIYTNTLPSAPPTATRSGYTLTGWTDSAGATYEGSTTVASDAVYTAQWKKDAAPTTAPKPTSNPGGGGGGSSSTPYTAPGGTATPTPTPTAPATVTTPTTPPAATPTAAPTTAPTTAPVTEPTPAEKGTKMTTADGFTFVSNGDGTAKLVKFEGSGTKVTVDKVTGTDGYEYTITSIGPKAFAEKDLTEVTIGKSVVKIGVKAFWECSSLGLIKVKTTKLTKASRVGKNSFGRIKKKALFKLRKKNFKKTRKAFRKKSGAKKPRYKKV